MSIRWRLTIFHAATTLVIVVVLVGALFAAIGISVDRAVRETAQTRALEAAQIVGASGTLSEADLARLSLNGVVLIVRDERGHVLAQTGDVVGETGAPDLATWHDALQSGRPAEGHVSLPGVTPYGPIYLYAVPVARPDGTVVVEAGRAYQETGRQAFYFAPVVLGAAFLGVVVAIGGSYLLARAAFAPVESIVRSARQITESDLSQRLPTGSRRDEIGRLAGTFNDLLARLEVAFAQREETLARQRRFVADASHELRTPLTSILGYARMLRGWGLGDPAIAREGVAAIEQEALRMSKLVEDLLHLARGDEDLPLVRVEHDLAEVAAAAAEAARAAAAGRVEVVYRGPERPVRASFDRDRIREVLDILLDNALKYTPPGGTVTVSARETARGAEVAVADTGVGIPPEHLPHIFDRFYRVDAARANGGAGLGLAIARQIVDRHGGALDVASQPGHGSTFTLRLPRSGT